MGSTDRRRTGRSPVAVLALAALVALLEGGCLSFGPEPFVEEGAGLGMSRSFDLDAGAYAISWSARDEEPPRDGCLFGLTLDREEAAPGSDGGGPVNFPLPKLAFQALDDGGSLNGRTALELPAGRYRFVVDGSCGWSLRVDGH